jgi:prephenate dehydratase
MTKKLKIAFQGEPGANSHIAIVEAYPDAEPLPCATFEDALAAISSGEADLGMIPIENSVAGRVADIHHLLPASGLFIVGEWFLADPASVDGARGAKLPTSRRWRATSTRSASAGASSASSASSRSSRPTPPAAPATFASARTRALPRSLSARAQIYGLDILAEDVEDEAHNTTRFVVLAREANWAKQGSGPLVTTFVFRVRNSARRALQGARRLSPPTAST